jgi:porin
VIDPPNGITPDEKSGTWAALYLGEQRLWEDPCNENRYTKLFGYVGFSEPANSPFQWTGSLSVEAFGRMISRPNDRMGIAYCYNALNSDFQNTFSTISPVGDLQGGEVYYNAQITPWFHVTADLQAVEPAVQDQDTALVLGLRAKLDF